MHRLASSVSFGLSPSLPRVSLVAPRTRPVASCAFSGPRSRADSSVRKPHFVNTGLAHLLLWQPRMGACARARHHRHVSGGCGLLWIPLDDSWTTLLLLEVVGLGGRAQARFAVATARVRKTGLDASPAARQMHLPASVGRSNPTRTNRLCPHATNAKRNTTQSDTKRGGRVT